MTNRPIGGFPPLELQLVGEAADKTRATGRELEVVLARLQVLCAEAPEAGHEGRGAWELRYRELREEAGRLRWSLIVQREALGILDNEDVYHCYPLPSCSPPRPPK